MASVEFGYHCVMRTVRSYSFCPLPICSNVFFSFFRFSRELKAQQEREQLLVCRRANAIEDGESLGLEDIGDEEMETALSGSEANSLGSNTVMEDFDIGGGLKVPGEIWSKLYT